MDTDVVIGIVMTVALGLLGTLVYNVAYTTGERDGRQETCEWVGGKGAKFKEGEGCIR